MLAGVAFCLHSVARGVSFLKRFGDAMLFFRHSCQTVSWNGLAVGDGKWRPFAASFSFHLKVMGSEVSGIIVRS